MGYTKLTKRNINNLGQMMAEVVIATGVIALVLIAISDLMSRSVKSFRLQKEKDEAIRLVESKLREYKGQRDANVTSFFSALPSGACTWSYVSTSPTSFACSVTSDTGSVSNGVKLTVTATWTDKVTNDKSVSLSTILTN